ncbi:MAG TPA: ATP-binding protein [Bacteroidales bacterium]
METLRKIGELIEQNKILEQRNEELKNIIAASLDQTTKDHDFAFQDSDLSDVKTLIVKFYQYNKIPTVLYNKQGTLIFSIGWKTKYSFFHHNFDELYQEYCEFTGKTSFIQKPFHFFKRNDGLHAVAFPLEIRNMPVATLILSQFFIEKEMPDTESLSVMNKSKETDPDLFNKALEEIQILNDHTLGETIKNASYLGEMISFLGLKNMEYQASLRKQTDNDTVFKALREKIAEQELIIKSLIQNISAHENEVRENTISKTAFQKQQKRLFERIKHSEALLNSLLTSLPLGICFIRKNIFTYSNDQMVRITGYTPKELIGRSPELLFADSQDYVNLTATIDNLIVEKKSFESPIVNKNGTIVDAIIFVSYIDAEEPDLGVTFSMMDISAIKKVQRELMMEKERAEESDRLKTAFLNNMSHEFRTPMNAIIGFTELINSPYFSDNQKKDYFKIVQGKGKKLLRLIDDIIDLSKLSSNQLHLNRKHFSVQEILDDLYDTFADSVQIKHGTTVVLKLTMPENPGKDLLFNDSFRIRQIITNLLSNSLKFTSHGTIEFGYQMENDCIRFFVMDTGKGIAKAKQKLIFERFRQCDDSFTREHGGAGMGLSLAKGIVELMGGKIWFESKWGVGTKFFFSIPLSSEQQINNNQKVRDIDWSEKTILIAEDEELNYRYLQALLQPTNVNIRWAENGQKAIDYVLNDPSINLILMDIRMPVLNGLEATKIIKSTNHTIPIIAQTAYAQSHERENYIKAGCDEFIPKPINTSHFISVLKKFLNTN